MPSTPFRLRTEEQKATRTIVDTIYLTPEIVKGWKSPPFQRPVKETAKVRDLAVALKTDGGVWPGIVTLGIIGGQTYIVDGQHRRAAFLLSGCKEGYTDVRIHHFGSMAEAGEEFVKLNSALARMNPDDILRGLEMSCPALQRIRHRAPFVGYDHIRHGAQNSPIVSMSILVKAWHNAGKPIPNAGGLNGGAAGVVLGMAAADVEQLCDFLSLAIEAFGRDAATYKMWGALNLTVVMWLYRRLVRDYDATPNDRHTKFHPNLFRQCMMSLSADAIYNDWLMGRTLSERDRGPAYSRVRSIFVRRAAAELDAKIKFPSPEWATSQK